jgi:hypothetical protein
VTTLTGSLQAARTPDLTGYLVTADYEREHDRDEGSVLPVSQRAETDAGGAWQIALDHDPHGEVLLTARTPAGVEVGSRTTAAFDQPLPIRLTDVATPIVIPPSDDPTYGRSLTITGRALQPDGTGVPDGLPVVLWGKLGEATPLPLLVTGTTAGGYFSGEWPSGSFDDAWATVAGGAPIPVRLADGRLPRVVLLVVPE